MDVSKKISRKTLAQDVLTENERFPILINYIISARSSNFVDLCNVVGIVRPTTSRTRVSDATAVTFSVKCFNPLKLYPLAGNIFRCFILFIYSRIFNNNVIASGKSYCCNT